MKTRKHQHKRRNRGSIATLPIWMTDGIERAAGRNTSENSDIGIITAIKVATAGTSDISILHIIGKHIAYVRMICNMDYDARKQNGHQDMWAVSVLCAEIYRDAIEQFNAAESAAIDAGDAKTLHTFVTTSMDFVRRHSESESYVAWTSLEDRRRLSLLLGIDPVTGNMDADAGKLEQYLKMKAAA